MAKDFLLKDGDLQIKNGDFAVGDSDEQHIEHLLLAHNGEYTQYPMLGIGISSYIHAPMNPAVRMELERHIRLQVQADGGQNVKINVTNENLKIKATYAD